MCVKHSTRFQKLDWKAPGVSTGDAQVVPFWDAVGKIDVPPTKLPLTVLTFSGTLVPIYQKERRSRRWRTFPPASGCGLGSGERTHHWANEETAVSKALMWRRGRAHRPNVWRTCHPNLFF